MTKYTLLAATLLLVVWGPASWSQEDSAAGDPFGGPAPTEPGNDPFAPPTPRNLPLARVKDSQEAPLDANAVPEQARSQTPVFIADSWSRQNEAIARKLSEPLSQVGFNFSENSLSEVVAFLREEYQIEVQLDIQALEDLGLSPDDTVTVNIRNVSLRSALELMLKQHDLAFLIVDDYLLITNEDECLSRLSVRVYPVGDLLQPEEGRPQSSAASVDDLIEVLITTVASDTWAENGGGAAEIRPLQPGLLIISQTQAVHEEIAHLLSALRRAREHELAIPYAPVEKKAKKNPSGGGFGGGGGAPADKKVDQPK